MSYSSANVTNVHKSIALFVGQIVLFFAETVVINQIGTAATIMQLALIRNLGGLTLAFYLFGRISPDIFHTTILWGQLGRAGLSVVTMWTLIYSFSHLSLTDATAVSYTQAVFLTVFSLVVLDERIPLLRWLAVLAGIAGTFIVIRPAFDMLQWAYAIALIGVGLNALVLVVTKPLERKDSVAKVMAYVSTVGVLCNLPSLTLYELPDATLWPWLMLMFVLGPVGMYLGILAIRPVDVDISILAPWVYLRLILAVGFSYVMLAEMPDPWTVVGATIIFLSCGLTVKPVSLKNADGGIPHERVKAWARSLGTDHELPIPRKGDTDG